MKHVKNHVQPAQKKFHHDENSLHHARIHPPIFYRADKIKGLVVSQSDYFAPGLDRLLCSKRCINQTLEFWSFSIISPAKVIIHQPGGEQDTIECVSVANSRCIVKFLRKIWHFSHLSSKKKFDFCLPLFYATFQCGP